MSSANGVDEVLASLDGAIRLKVERGKLAMEQVMAFLEGKAKSEHLYRDRTANTTNSIRGFVAEATPAMIRGVLSAGMDYDVFLELAREGKWAFLMPILTKYKGDILKIFAAVLTDGTVSGVTATTSANPEAAERYEEHRASTSEERRADPEGARRRDMAYRDAVRARRKGNAP